MLVPCPPDMGSPPSYPFPPWPVLTQPRARSISPPSLTYSPTVPGAGSWSHDAQEKESAAQLHDSVSFYQETNVCAALSLHKCSTWFPSVPQVSRQVSSWRLEAVLLWGTHLKLPSPSPDASDMVATSYPLKEEGIFPRHHSRFALRSTVQYPHTFT